MKHICGPDHKHAASTNCYHKHGCRCEPCRTTQNTRANRRRRNIAYGRHQGLMKATGTSRRIRGLYVLGWTSQDIADVTGLERKRVNNLTRTVMVTPRVRNLIVNATRELLSRGRGNSDITVRRAKANGWVSLFEWNSIDDDPLSLEERQRWAT